MAVLAEFIGIAVLVVFVVMGAYFYVKRFTTFNQDTKKKDDDD